MSSETRGGFLAYYSCRENEAEMAASLDSLIRDVRREALEEGLRELLSAIPEDFFTRDGGDKDEVRPWLPLGALRRARKLLEKPNGD